MTLTRNFYYLLSFVGCLWPLSGALARQKTSLSVDHIMQGEQWIGRSPKNPQWDPNSQHLYFRWASGDEEERTYQVSLDALEPIASSTNPTLPLTGRILFSNDRSLALYERDGEIILRHIAEGREQFLTHTLEEAHSPNFSLNDKHVVFKKGNNLFSIALKTGEVTSLSNLITDEKLLKPSTQERALREKQLKTFRILQEQEEGRGHHRMNKSSVPTDHPIPFHLRSGEKISELTSSPDERFIAFTIESNPAPARTIIVPDYVTASGYTEVIPGRPKVGGSQPTYKSYLYDRIRDTVYPVHTASLPGIKDIPHYLHDYPAVYQQFEAKNTDRIVQVAGYWWSPDAKNVVVNILSQDHKDRWIMRLDPLTGALTLLDRQHDDAWIAGPGIMGKNLTMGWVDADVFYYQSEASGFSHLYTVSVTSGEKKQLTHGKYEVLSVQLARDKQHFYFTANKKHPGTTEYYRIKVSGGEPVQITALGGQNEVLLSPDEKWLAIRHSYINKPWELYLQKNAPGEDAVQLTKSTTAAFDAYPWRVPTTITFTNRHGNDIYAQILQPAGGGSGSPAVVFVHSNGYLQNVHDGWSYHYREYLFNNLLTDLGYTVINIDYTGSAGYGRTIRTGIYRHMGGQDLTDLVDGVHYLTAHYPIDPARVGLYGGSYGGFLTLMGLFTESNTFKAGAALRSVTDWSNYNQRYTSNILNDPQYDKKAYQQSSPLFFAEGLKGHLLMTHGVVDVNVNFQDIVLLTQKLIELKKEHWDLAIYPKEDHDFVDAASWSDQYKRILNFFNQTLMY